MKNVRQRNNSLIIIEASYARKSNPEKILPAKNWNFPRFKNQAKKEQSYVDEEIKLNPNKQKTKMEEFKQKLERCLRKNYSRENKFEQNNEKQLMGTKSQKNEKKQALWISKMIEADSELMELKKKISKYYSVDDIGMKRKLTEMKDIRQIILKNQLEVHQKTQNSFDENPQIQQKNREKATSPTKFHHNYKKRKQMIEKALRQCSQIDRQLIKHGPILQIKEINTCLRKKSRKCIMEHIRINTEPIEIMKNSTTNHLKSLKDHLAKNFEYECESFPQSILSKSQDQAKKKDQSLCILSKKWNNIVSVQRNKMGKMSESELKQSQSVKLSLNGNLTSNLQGSLNQGLVSSVLVERKSVKKSQNQFSPWERAQALLSDFELF